MACKECEKAQESGDVYPYRIGANGIGYGIILIIGCKIHASMAIDLLNDFPKAMSQLEEKFKGDLKLFEDKLEHMKKAIKDLDDKMERLHLL